MSKGFIHSLAKLVILLGPAFLASAALAASGAPGFTSRAVDLGVHASNKVVPVTVWLRLHDAAGLASKVQAMHDPSSPRFQNFETLAALEAQHAPTAAEASAVSQYLAANGLGGIQVGAHNLFVRAVGTSAQVSRTFNVELHDFQFRGRTYFANTARPKLHASMQPLVSHVSLTDFGAQPHVARVATSAPLRLSSIASPDGLLFSAGCVRQPESHVFTDPANGITATYSGNRYGADITSGPPNLPPCGYQPSEIAGAYGLNALYRAGRDGTGTTIAIVDAFGSTTIANDVAAFSAYMGLPAPKLTIIGTSTESNFSTDANASWAAETTLDVEWVHAVAPGANILLVVTPTNSFDDLFNGIITAATTPGVSVISNSWGGFDIGIAGDSEFYGSADGLFAAISAAGIGVNFATGDDGNNADQLGGSYTSTGWPASSPYVTGIGGVSMALGRNGSIAMQTAWGTNLTQITDTQANGWAALDVPNNEGFVFGSTGGLSDTYPLPWFQYGLPYNRRATPDISWLADPYTGVEIIYSADASNDLAIGVIGGTSLACPMFSALWGITTQAAGHNLGQAAPYLYRLDGLAITDIRAVSSSQNVSGSITDPFGTNQESAHELAAPLQNLPTFYSAFYNSPNSTRWFVITFGTDTTLQAGPGFDLATGLGVPNPPFFVQEIARRSR
ncbi:MAG TPA: S53 family peptidase [Steroidobacteraceae bacterium]|nr:S53 family peptidase [Steroidobacteraceae bacterium]